MRPDRDLRAYAQSTQVRLAVGAILLLFLVGDGLVWIMYGSQAAGLALLCTGIGLSPLVLIVLFLWIMERFVGNMRDE